MTASVNDNARGPGRIQQRRTRGWRKPPDAVSIVRGTRWGNPFTVAEHGRDESIRRFRIEAVARHQTDPCWLMPLRGRVLMCWCKPDEACHGDVLLDLVGDAASVMVAA